MKRLMTAVCCACVLGVASVSAAQEHQMEKGKMGTMGKGMMPMSVTGCVSEKDGHYMLDNAMMAGDMKAMPAGDMKATSYHLAGGDLKAHVGHKVEVTGSLDAKAKMGDDKMAMGKMGGDKMAMGKMGAADAHGTLNVTAVKMISATCP